jgi:heme/copper-type cytochrome/quinol oxidase subunit 3
VTLALPAGPAPAARRQIFVGTALAALAGTTMMGGMLAVWALIRQRAVDAGERFPVNFIIPEVATNVMLITLFSLCLFAQWAVYSARRGDRAHTGLALGVVLVLGIAYVNAQAFVYTQMEMPLAGSGYATMFYAITGTMVAMVVAGLVYTVVAMFRSLGGRDREFEVISAHAMYWYFIAAAYAAMWFLVYVTK